MKKIIYIIFMFFVGITSAKALGCDYSSFRNIQKQALQVNITSDFVEKEDTVRYSVTIYNLVKNQYVIETNTGKKYNYGYNKNNPSKITIENIEKPGIYKFEVYSLDNECNEDSLNTLYVTLPTYNKYYKDKLCEGIETYKLCQRWFGTNITYEQFKKQISEYKNSLNINLEEEKEPTFFDYLLELYLNTYYIVLPVIIIVLLVPIYIIYQKKYKIGF